MEPASHRPYISFVLPVRNDGYGGGLKRVQVCVESLLQQLERHRIPSELILVDWNTPADRPPVHEGLTWPTGLRSCSAKAFVVPHAVHQTFPLAAQLPFLATKAFNAGVRRARGEFILSLTQDLIYSDPLMRMIAERRLDPKAMYRIDLSDVAIGVLDVQGLDERLRFCEQNITGVRGSPEAGNDPQMPLHTNGAGDFILMSRDVWWKVNGWPELHQDHGLYMDGVLCYKAFAAGAKEVMLRPPVRLYHVEHDSRWRRQGPMARLRSLLLGSSGREPRIPPRVRAMLVRLDRAFAPKSEFQKRGVRELTPQGYRDIVLRVMRGERGDVYNEPNWGLAGHDLQAVHLGGPDAPLQVPARQG